MESQQHAVESALQQGVDLVVSDPAPLMTAVYSIQYFNDHSLLPSAIHDIANADLVVWCAPDVPWQPDGKHRDGPQARDLTDQLIRSQIEPTITGTHLIRVSGSPAGRLETVLTALGSSPR
jgi:nicotinamide riboside kinase